jgi:flavin reductase (DIM6/NTAB) family NADH-FMN oxidoreductase RutF
MKRQQISAPQLDLRPFGFWDDNWALLAAGDFAGRRFNCMTVSWGALGNMWNRPFVMVVVRPQRYTRQFTDRYDTFTLSVFDRRYRPALERLGSQSGRTMDKINDSGFTPIPSAQIASPGFDEADVILECRKIYFDDLNPAHFLADFIAPNYRDDYHRIYFGHLVATWATAEYVRAAAPNA